MLHMWTNTKGWVGMFDRKTVDREAEDSKDGLMSAFTLERTKIC